MRILTTHEVFDLIQKEVEFNLTKAKFSNKELTSEFKIGILDANQRLIDLQQRILDM